MLLIADCGSTKTAWTLVDRTNTIHLQTEGMNPYYQSAEDICTLVTQTLRPQLGDVPVDAVFFYGAGCSFPDKMRIVERALRVGFPEAKMEVQSDLLAAARGTCGDRDGIVAILGTGSNSCFYQRGRIARQVPALGFILGDEGSGAVLGRKLISDRYKNQLPTNLAEAFDATFHTDAAHILDKVYKEPFPNRYLASFVPFIHQFQTTPYMQEFLLKAFTEFAVRNLRQYDTAHFPIHLTGSIAFYFQEALKSALQRQGMRVGSICQTPLLGLTEYHRKKFYR